MEDRIRVRKLVTNERAVVVGQCDLHMDEEMCLEHQFVNLSVFPHDLFAVLGQQQKPPVDNGIRCLDDLTGCLLCHDSWHYLYRFHCTSHRAYEVGEGRETSVLGAELAIVESLQGLWLGDLLNTSVSD